MPAKKRGNKKISKKQKVNLSSIYLEKVKYSFKRFLFWLILTLFFYIISESSRNQFLHDFLRVMTLIIGLISLIFLISLIVFYVLMKTN